MSKKNTAHTVHQGKLKQWNKDKGFGYIGHDAEKQDIFLHASEFRATKTINRKPVVGDTIYYQVVASQNGKTQAVNASFSLKNRIDSRLSSKYAVMIKDKLQAFYKIASFIIIFLVIATVYDMVV